jgi:hypothetical protein
MAWVVEVNECRVFATRAGSAWWSLYRLHMDFRMTDIVVSLGGNLVHVACDDEDEARWLASSMVDNHGLPPKAVKAKRVAVSERAA